MQKYDTVTQPIEAIDAEHDAETATWWTLHLPSWQAAYTRDEAEHHHDDVLQYWLVEPSWTVWGEHEPYDVDDPQHVVLYFQATSRVSAERYARSVWRSLGHAGLDDACAVLTLAADWAEAWVL